MYGLLPEARRTLLADWVLGASGSSKTSSRIGWPDRGPFVRCHGVLSEAIRTLSASNLFGPLTGALMKFMWPSMISSRASSSSFGVNLLAGGLIGVSPCMVISAGGGFCFQEIVRCLLLPSSGVNAVFDFNKVGGYLVSQLVVLA